MSYKVTVEAVREALEDDTTLQTLRNQYTAKEVFDMIEDKDEIEDEDDLFTSLMDVMYATRPVGVT